jgi:glyoxylase-like metal-dependent hydrolase (beta-lactamase superfamily II)
MVYLGIAHADDSSALYFPDERAVFSADVMQVKRLPGAVAPTIGSWIDALKTINALDYEYALTGHALAGTKKDALEAQQYLEDLSAGVTRASRGTFPRRDSEDADTRQVQGIRAVGQPTARHTSRRSTPP